MCLLNKKLLVNVRLECAVRSGGQTYNTNSSPCYYMEHHEDLRIYYRLIQRIYLQFF